MPLRKVASLLDLLVPAPGIELGTYRLQGGQNRYSGVLIENDLSQYTPCWNNVSRRLSQNRHSLLFPFVALESLHGPYMASV